MISLTTSTSNGVAMRRLDVGAGAKTDEGWETMDVSPAYSPDFQHDMLQMPWPFEDATFDELRCWHVLEHIERQHLIPVMNEMHRILKPGGVADIEVPVFPYWTAIADPTHISFFVPQTWAYFCTIESYNKAVHGARAFDNAMHRTLYGIKEWTMLKAFRDEMGAIMRVELTR